jgi:hypothetical protein
MTSVKDDYNEEYAKIGEAETFVQNLLGNRLEMYKQKNGNDYVSLVVSEDAYT